MLERKTTQQQVAEFIDQHSLDATVHARLLEVNAKVGELAREFLKTTSYGQKEFRPAPEWQHELGDAYFALLALAIESDVDLENALQHVVRAYDEHIQEAREGEPHETP